MTMRYLYPFAAVVGNDDVKEALLIALVNPRVGGVLISGDKAGAKTTLIRASAELTPMRIVELPLSATEDRIFGHIDLEKTLADGRKVLAEGLLAEAHHNILYIDEVNLLRRDVLTAVLQAHDLQENRIEREGISYRHDADFLLVGSMNPQEGTLETSVLDRFGLFVNVEASNEPAQRVEIMRRVLQYERDRIRFVDMYAEETASLQEQVRKAVVLVAAMKPPAPMLQLAAAYAEKAWLAGHRGDVILLEAAKAIAALAGRSFLIPEDMERAAYFVLPHRMRKPPAAPPQEQEGEEQEDTSAENPDTAPPEDNTERGGDENQESGKEDRAEDSDYPNTPQTEAESGNNTTDESQDEEDSAEENIDYHSQAPLPPESWEDIDKALAQLQLQMTTEMNRHERKGSGKRQRTKTNLRQGRYIRAVLTGQKVTDLALDATIRAAAPYQRHRHRGNLAIALTESDLRQKVREKRTGTVFLFCVDASGSMGAKHRMGVVKGVIYGLLQDAYEKRDRVGLITFRREQAELLLPITRSIDLAQRELRELPTGGKTPLAAGMQLSLATLQQLRYQDAEVRPVFILVTDGRATAALQDGNPVADAEQLATVFRRANITSVVIDTETDFISMGIAKKIAELMGAHYYHMKRLSDENVLAIVQDLRM